MNLQYTRMWVAVLAVIVVLAIAATVSADTIVVKPDEMNGWVVGTQEASGGAPIAEFRMAGPSATPAGTGSFHFKTDILTGEDPLEKIYLGTNNHSGVSLRDITSLKYYTYLKSARYNPEGGWPDGQPPILEIITDSGSSTQQRRFVYKPYGWMGEFNVAFETWQEWDCMAENSGCWEKIGANDAAMNVFGDWNWLINRYGTVESPMRLATPVVGDYMDYYTVDYKYGNQSGTSLSLRVGSGRTSDWMLNRSIMAWEQKPWWKESCGIDAYADKLVIGINGVETVYDFERGNAMVVAVTPSAVRDHIMVSGSKNFFFVVFGKVLADPAPSGSEFYLDDGSGKKIKVIAQNAVIPGEYWRAQGTLEWNSDVQRYDLLSSTFDISPLN